MSNNHIEFRWLEVDGAIGYDLYVGEPYTTPEPMTFAERVKHRFATRRIVSESRRLYEGVYTPAGTRVFGHGLRVETKRWWERWGE